MNKVRSTLVNEYTVGGSLLLVGFGFFSTRFADVLSYQVATIPSMIPVIGGASVTVGRVLGIVPATLGLAVLFRKARDVPVVSEATELPLVKTIVNYVEDLSDEMGGTIEATPVMVMDLSAEEFDAEQLLLCSEHDDYFNACGCGSKNAEMAPVTEKVEVKKKTTGSPKQQAWRSCVSQAKGDMAEAKRLYTAMGY